MRSLSFVLLIIFFGACKPTFVRYTDLHHVENVQRIKVISKSKLKYEVLKDHSSEILRDTLINYKPCAVTENKENCLLYLENKHVIVFRGSYYIKSSAWVNYVGQEKYKRYINKDVKF